MLAAAELAAHLIEHRLLPARALVRDGTKFVDRSRRNRNFEVIPRGRRGLFVKQSRDAQLQVEARVYSKIGAHDALRRFVPRFIAFDRSAGVLVLERCAAAVTINERLRRSSMTELGRAVAAIHEQRSDRRLRSDAPWVLSLTAPAAELVDEISSANLQMLRIVQECDALCAMLDSLRRTWRARCRVHNDLRLSNCLVSRTSSRLKIVDWELAAGGDPSWDVACVLADLLWLWSVSLPLHAERRLSVAASRKEHRLHEMQRHMNTFWSSYSQCRHLNAGRVVRFAAARLLQSVYESMDRSMHLSAAAVVVLQISANIAKYPERAASELFNLQ